MGMERAEFRAWIVALLFSLAVNVLLLVMPWYPPAGGRFGGDVSFWYATYCAVGVAILGVCGVYWWVWIHFLPGIRGYKIRQELVSDGDVSVHVLVKVPDGEVERWDATHDVLGNVVASDGGGSTTGVDDTSRESLRERGKGGDVVEVGEKV